MHSDLPPYDEDAEGAILGSLLIDSEALKMIDFLEAADFFSEQNQLVFQSCQNVGDGIDQITVAQDLVSRGKLDDIGGPAYLSHLVAIVPTSLHVKHYAEIVFNLSLKRRLISASGQIESWGYGEDKADVCLEKSRKCIQKLERNLIDDSVLTSRKLAENAMDWFNDTATEKFYIKTGIPSLDSFEYGLGGLIAEHFVLGARTTMGKTTLALGIARHVAVESPVLYISLEQGAKQITNKNISAYTRISEKRLNLGKIDDAEGRKISMIMADITELKLSVAEGSRTIDSIERMIEREYYANGIVLAVIDYVQLVGGGDGRSENDRIGNISHRISNLVKDLKIPILTLSQLSRAVEYRDDKTPKLTDFRDSGDIEQDADTAGIMTRPYGTLGTSMAGCVLPGPAVIYMLKNRLRDGETGTIQLGWENGQYK